MSSELWVFLFASHAISSNVDKDADDFFLAGHSRSSVLQHRQHRACQKDPVHQVRRKMQLRSPGRNNETSERGVSRVVLGCQATKIAVLIVFGQALNFMVPGQNVLVIFGCCYSGADQDTVSIAKALRFPAKTESILYISCSIPSQVKMKASE
jgi:hypothetical protein